MLDSEKVVTLFKLEASYGTDAAPTGVDALVTSQVKMTPFQAQGVSRDLDKPAGGSDLQLQVGVQTAITFRTELVGSGTLGTAPAFGKLFKACRCKETIVAATSVTYGPDKSSSSATIYFFLDGNKHALVGARGTFRLGVDTQNIPYIEWTFTGLYVPPSALAAPVALTGWDAFQIPEPVSFENTPIPTLHGYTAGFVAFSFDAGVQISVANDPGHREVRAPNHAATGQITMFAPLLSDKDYFAIAKAQTLGTMKVEHGTTAGKKWFFEAAEDTVQITNPDYADSEGRATLVAGLNFVPTNAGNDEWELRFAAA